MNMGEGGGGTPELEAKLSLASELARSKEWVEQTRALTDGISFGTTSRLRIAQTYFRLSLEHHLGLHALMELEVHASGKALLRPQLDAFLRGVWFLEKATESEIAQWMRGERTNQIPPKYTPLIAALETIERYSDGGLRMLHDETLRLLHDFTHGGKLQIAAFNSGDEIKSNFKDLDILSMLRTSSTLAWLAANEMFGICGLEERTIELSMAHQRIYGP